ncbi:hypothetical protein ACH4C6_34380 [Streptomyces sp. NPDC017943]
MANAEQTATVTKHGRHAVGAINLLDDQVGQYEALAMFRTKSHT